MVTMTVVIVVLLLPLLAILAGWLVTESRNSAKWIRITTGLVLTLTVAGYLVIGMYAQHLRQQKDAIFRAGNLERAVWLIEAGKATELVPVLQNYRARMVSHPYEAEVSLSEDLDRLLQDVDIRVNDDR